MPREVDHGEGSDCDAFALRARAPHRDSDAWPLEFWIFRLFTRSKPIPDGGTFLAVRNSAKYEQGAGRCWQKVGLSEAAQE